jgi:hypothetical protein
MVLNIKERDMNVMQEFYLRVIAEVAKKPMQLALASLCGAGISYRVRATAPNVVEYRCNNFGCDIKGTLTF